MIFTFNSIPNLQVTTASTWPPLRLPSPPCGEKTGSYPPPPTSTCSSPPPTSTCSSSSSLSSPLSPCWQHPPPKPPTCHPSSSRRPQLQQQYCSPLPRFVRPTACREPPTTCCRTSLPSPSCRS